MFVGSEQLFTCSKKDMQFQKCSPILKNLRFKKIHVFAKCSGFQKKMFMFSKDVHEFERCLQMKIKGKQKEKPVLGNVLEPSQNRWR